MQNLSSRIDKIGLILFLLILIVSIYEFSLIDFSVAQNIGWQFYIFLLCGFLVIFRSIRIKFASLLLSVAIILSAYSFLINLKFETKTFHTLVHHLYSQGITFWELSPFILLIAVTIYNLYVILVHILVERKKKINFK